MLLENSVSDSYGLLSLGPKAPQSQPLSTALPEAQQVALLHRLGVIPRVTRYPKYNCNQYFLNTNKILIYLY
jgi:hypothetical protein